MHGNYNLAKAAMDSKNSTSNAIQTPSSLTASCHCASVSLPIHLLKDFTDQKFPLGVPLCHCSNCRHNTGLLCTSYIAIAAPPVSVLVNTTAYPRHTSSRTGIQRYFCSKCGCHVFRSSREAGDPGRGDSAGNGQIEEERMWEVATGVLSDVLGVVRISRHENVRDTIDGGLSIFISEQNHHSLPFPIDEARPDYQYCKPEDSHEGVAVAVSAAKTDPRSSQNMTGHDVLRGHCACHTVEFHISRPNAASLLPHSPFPDLMIPYYTQDSLIPNPHDEKWWLRSPSGASISTAAPVKEVEEIGGEEEAGTRKNSIIASSNPPTLNGAKYLAGTCACRSCRLTSGFEIQTWTFIPRTNIYFHLPRLPEDTSPSLPPPPPPSLPPPTSSTTSLPTKLITPLDFPTLRAHKPPLLTTYESSPGVEREFCATCGSTVFWHDKWRPDIIDVSVGLLDASEGARAEKWLEWWGGRVSFAEERGRGMERRGEGIGGEGGGGEGGREGGGDDGKEVGWDWDWDLIPALGRGLRRWKG